MEAEFQPPGHGEPKSGYQCRRPIIRETDRGEVVCRCRKCEPCLSSAKQDVVGRVIAQAITSKCVLFATLTYRDGEPGAMSFRKVDWDRAINRLRMDVSRAFGTRIKVLYAFERGPNGTRRCHVHALLMFDGPHGLAIPADPKARAWFDWWPHGHVNIVEVTGQPGELARRCRYIAMYTGKAKGGQEQAPYGWSKRDLGVQFLRDLARDHAQKGLVPKGFYHLPGLIFTKGKRSKVIDPATGRQKVDPVTGQALWATLKGQHQKFYLRGAGAREFAKAFRQAWEAKWPDRPTPALPWMLAADDQAVDPVLTGRGYRKPVGWKPRAKAQWKPHDCTAWKTVRVADGFAGMLRLDRDGRATFMAQGDDRPVRLGPGFAELPPGVADSDRQALLAWAADIRGPGWRDPADLARARSAVGNALRSRDVRSRVGQLVERGAGQGQIRDGDPLGLPEAIGGDLRRRVLAAKLGKP